jgi:hypothetical protein
MTQAGVERPGWCHGLSKSISEVGIVPVGVVETEDGHLHVVPVEHIQFVEPPLVGVDLDNLAYRLSFGAAQLDGNVYVDPQTLRDAIAAVRELKELRKK